MLLTAAFGGLAQPPMLHLPGETITEISYELDTCTEKPTCEVATR